MNNEPAISKPSLFGRKNLSLEEAEGATWEEVLEESGEEGEQVVGSGRSGGRERRSGAEVTRVVTRELTREVGSGGHERGDEGAHEGALERSRRRLCVTKPEMLTQGKNPKASLIFGEKSIQNPCLMFYGRSGGEAPRL